MDAPTPDELRTVSPLLTERYPETTGDEALGTLTAAADAYVMLLTGRSIGGATGAGPFGCVLEEMPDVFRPLLVTIAARFVERTAVSTEVEVTEDSITAAHGGLASISAGPWSESYFNPSSIVERRSLDEDPTIGGLLWALATDCVRAAWERLWHPEIAGVYAPARADEVTDWFPEGRSNPWPYEPLGPMWAPGSGWGLY